MDENMNENANENTNEIMNENMNENMNEKPPFSRRTAVWAVSSIAAVAAFFILRPQTAEPQYENIPVDLTEQVHLLSQTALEDAEKCVFEPIEGGYILTAYFPDGSEGKYLLSSKDDKQSFFLISLNDPTKRR